MKRYQVKAAEREWTDEGPDLLRTNENATRRLRDAMAQGSGWYVRTEGPEGYRSWQGPMGKKDALVRFDVWSPNEDGRRIQFGRKRGKAIEERFVAKIAVITGLHLEDCSAEVETVYSLLEYVFPHRRLGGAFVCKQVAGSSTWSQHAYGKALDHTDADPDSYPDERTPQAFDWSLRMAREGYALFPAHHIIGTQDRVQECQALLDEGWVVRDYPGAGTHTWHLHASCGPKDSTGTPPCA